ncbi:MAG: class I SAM-dependent methyltransferase [Acidobacteria bacterium]|nr:MAG: class I SAM-dependent methyltransferase [Acidobacteriota bacterium]
MEKLENQDNIWRYFQGEGKGSFDGSCARHDFLVCQVGRWVRPPAAILNIGAGNGYLETALQRRGFDSHSLDPDDETVARLAAAGIHAQTGRIEAIPFESATFAAIVATEVFEHLNAEQWRAGLQEIWRVLQPGGVLLGTVPYCEPLTDSLVVCPGCGARFHRWGHQQTFSEANFHEGMRSTGRAWQRQHLEPHFFWAWGQQNWKGKIAALAKSATNLVGAHGKNENLVFVYQKP